MITVTHSSYLHHCCQTHTVNLQIELGVWMYHHL
jgi:hypothetical protein